MKIYRSYNELYPATLQLGDILEFTVNNKNYYYKVEKDHLRICDTQKSNLEIFYALGIYNTLNFCFPPESISLTDLLYIKSKNYKSLKSLALALFKKCYEKSNIENNKEIKSTDFDYKLINIRQSKILNTIDSKINKVKGELCLTEKSSYEAVLNLYEMDDIEEYSRFINKYLNAKKEQEKWEQILHNLSELKLKIYQ